MKMIIKLKMINWIIFGYISIFQWNLENINGAIIEASGCYHNGTVYADRSLVPTLEPCLSCKCNSRMLICSLKVCPEMPVPPPRGCVLVHRKNSCCPYLSCLKVHNFYNGINGRIVSYLNHYERESIDRAVNENFLQRRSDDFDMDTSGEICIKNGTVYKSGSAMSSSSLCSYCYCIGGQQRCVKPKCMLPLEGCKAIFVDSTCCPVRYDCSSKTLAGKSAHRSHARKTSNKHYLRISQRYQRNRGCTIGYDYYHEGEKMPNDIDSPCDICFCIRGIKKCAPKKCSPSLRYCIPVIPKGQCCPSSYECGSSRDNINRSYKSRQIGLFSLIFGSDENDNSTDSTVGGNIEKISGEVTSEKSIFDVIREGLEYIDSSSTTNLNNSFSQLNNISSSTSIIHSTVNPITKKPNLGSEDEDDNEDDDDNFSFLDILLGRTKTNTTLNATTLASNHNSSINEENYKDYDDDFFDIFLESTNSTIQDLKKTNNSLLKDITTTSMYDLDYFGTTENHTPITDDDFSGTQFDEESTTEENEIENTVSTTDLVSTFATTENFNDWTTEDDSSTTEEIMSRTEDESTADTEQPTESVIDTETSISDVNELSAVTTAKNDDIYSTIPTYLSEDYVNTEPRFNIELSTTMTNIISTADVTAGSNKGKIENSTYSGTNTSNEMINNNNYNSIDNSGSNNNNRIRYPSNDNSTTTSTTSTTSAYSKEPITDDLFTSLLNGLSNLLGDDHPNIPNRTDIIISNIPIPPNNATTEKMSEKNMTTGKIDEMIHSTTPFNLQQSTEQLEIINAKTASQINNLASVTTENSAVIIKTNPSILDLPYDYGHRTLPPSLPNLKIIPFLPVDALPTEKRQIGSSFPSIDRHSSVWSQGNSFDDDIKSVKKQYEHSERYPSITYSDSNIDDDSNLDSKIIYLGNRNGFSPPTKTEGGFVPREPIVGGNLYYDSKIIIELTTTTPPFSSITQSTKQNQEQNQIIAITSTDRFKDVLKAESPPDLISLIVDKENQKSNRLPIISFESNENNNKNDKDIIHITTDTNYNLTPQYNNAEERIDYGQNLNISNISFTEKMGLFEKINSTDYNSNKNYSIIELENSIDDKLNKDNNVFNNLVEYFISDNNNNNNNDNIPSTIPPFKNLPPNIIFDKFFIPKKSESTSQQLSTNPEINSNIEIITMPPSQSININNSDNLNILEKLLLKTEYTVPDSELYKPVPHRKMTTLKEYENNKKNSIQSVSSSVTISTTNDPFKGLPLTQSYPVKPLQQIDKKIIKDEYQTELDIILSKINKKSNIKGATYTVGAYKLIPNDATISSTDSYVINPIDVDKLKKENHQQHLEYKSNIPAQISSKSTTNNSINDAAGILLAGCNIYGRMYRVGKIISELSDDCLECKCTEIGVSCVSLKCEKQ